MTAGSFEPIGKEIAMGQMMDGMSGGAMWGMGLIGVLVLILLVLGVAAPIKYLFSGN